MLIVGFTDLNLFLIAAQNQFVKGTLNFPPNADVGNFTTGNAQNVGRNKIYRLSVFILLNSGFW
jgi:hypothetical protein